MKQGFFGPLGDTLQAIDEAELLRLLNGIKIKIPRRSEGRKTSDRERATLVYYLRALVPPGLLGYPLILENRESPDFGVTEGGGRVVGWEISEAGDPEFQAAATRFESAPPGSLLEGTEIRLPGEPLRNKPFSGGEPERFWVEDLLHTIEKKSTKLQEYEVEPCDLLIYDNSRYRLFTRWSVDELLGRLSIAVRDWQSQGTLRRYFRRISVIRDRVAMFDVTGASHLLPIYWPDMPRSVPEKKLGINVTDLVPFCRRNKIRKLGFFGSIREDRFGPNSDVDVLVEFEADHRIGLIALGGLQVDLTEMLGRDVDLRTVPDLSRYFREDVVRNKTELAYVAG